MASLTEIRLDSATDWPPVTLPFDAETTGKDFVLEPASDEDMRGKFAAAKASLEVVYDNA